MCAIIAQRSGMCVYRGWKSQAWNKKEQRRQKDVGWTALGSFLVVKGLCDWREVPRVPHIPARHKCWRLCTGKVSDNTCLVKLDWLALHLIWFATTIFSLHKVQTTEITGNVIIGIMESFVTIPFHPLINITKWGLRIS